MDTVRRKKKHETIRAEIKASAWKQIIKSGSASLSMGAVAREMGLTTPALYRYFPSRKALINALSREAYDALIDALQQAIDRHPGHDHAGRFRSLCLAYHAWARSAPHAYLLIFGTPLPLDQFEPETGAAADRAFQMLLDVLVAAARDGSLDFTPPRGRLPLSPTAVPRRGRVPAAVMYLALAGWSLIHGITSLELSRRYDLLLGGQTGAFLQMEVERFMQQIGLE